MAAGPGQPDPGGQPTAADGTATAQDRRAGSGGDQRPAAGRARRWSSRPGLGAGRAGWVGGPPGAAGHGPDCLEAPALGPGRPGLPRVSGGVSSLFGTKVGRLVLAW